METFNIEKKYNFGSVEKAKLYRCAQPSKDFILYLKEKYNIKTIVDLRAGIEKFEKESAQNLKINLLHLPITFNIIKNPSNKDITAFLNLFENPENLPILLHCRKGKDRTGLMTAFFRLYCQNWPEIKIRREMKDKNVNLYWRFFFLIKIKIFKVKF